MVKTELFDGRTIRVIGMISIASVLSACSLIPTYVKASDLQIEKLETPTARVISAYVSTYRSQLSLHGQVAAKTVRRRPLRGHLDISIIRPNTKDVTCLTTADLVGPRRIRKRGRVRIRWPDQKSYFVELDEMPLPGTQIRIWHDPTNQHTSCVEPPVTSKPDATVDVHA